MFIPVPEYGAWVWSSALMMRCVLGWFRDHSSTPWPTCSHVIGAKQIKRKDAVCSQQYTNSIIYSHTQGGPRYWATLKNHHWIASQTDSGARFFTNFEYSSSRTLHVFIKYSARLRVLILTSLVAVFVAAIRVVSMHMLKSWLKTKKGNMEIDEIFLHTSHCKSWCKNGNSSLRERWHYLPYVTHVAIFAGLTVGNTEYLLPTPWVLLNHGASWLFAILRHRILLLT